MERSSVFLVFQFTVIVLALHGSGRAAAAESYGGGDSDEAPMEEAEKEALYSAIRGFVGDWWNGSDLYPDPCGWTPIQGVACDLFNGKWYVTSLNIGPVHENSLDCGPQPIFTRHVFNLKHLNSLSIFNCFLSPDQTLPPDIYWDNLSGTLESLELRSNPGLAGNILSSFSRLRSLQSLVILENRLNGSLPENLGNMSRLKRLVLAGNRFSGQIPDNFRGLSNLLILDMSGNSLSGPLHPSIGDLSSLLKLDLSNNMLQGNLPEELGKLRNLTLLDLRNNNFSGGLVHSIQEMESLQELILSGNPIAGKLDTVNWQSLKNLEILDLSGTGLTGEVPETFPGKIRFLGLSNNSLSGSLTPKLEALPWLNALYINGNNLTGEMKFSSGFYGRMGRRFGAWDNPNLCYNSDELGQNGNFPFEVRPCGHEEQEKEEMVEGGGHGNSKFLDPFGLSSNGVDGFQCCSFWVDLVMLLALVSNYLL